MSLYIPRHFAETDQTRLVDLMRSNNFGILVSAGDPQPHVTHLPFLVDADDGAGVTLHGHFARANPHWRALRGAGGALAIFQGPHCYVSPSGYVDRSNVPTWNYAVVHASGPVSLIDDGAELLHIVTRLTRVHENDRPAPWQVENAGQHLDRLLAAIVGFRMRVEALSGKFKLSQNRSGEDQESLVTALSASSDPGQRGIAELMKANRQSRSRNR